MQTEEKAHFILSLDIGSSMGWAFLKDAVILQSGVKILTRKDTHPGDRFVRFSNWLNNFITVNEIFYEDVPRFESAYSAKSYCGYLSILQMFCLVNRIRLVCIKPNVVKMGFTGKGNAKKPEMCRVCHELGWKHGHPATDIDHDEADAIACAWVLLKRRGVEPSFKR